MMHHANRAFALRDLLAVIVVLTLSVSVFLPMQTAVRAQAGTVTGLDNLLQIGVELSTYTTAHNNTLPPGYSTAPSGEAASWTTLLTGQMRGIADMTYDQVYVNPQAGGHEPIFLDPNAPIAGGDLHYSGNPLLLPNLGGEQDPEGEPAMSVYDMAFAVRTDEVMVVADGNQWDGPTNGTGTRIQGNALATAWRIEEAELADTRHYFDAVESDNDTTIDPGPNEEATPTNGVPRGYIRWRQGNNDAANMLFLDGHAATMNAIDVKQRNIRPDRPG